MRALFVAFYFPPAGGGGVQRTLKFCKYLPEFGIEVHVLTPDDPKWFARDDRLLAQVPDDTVVHRCAVPRPPLIVPRGCAGRPQRPLPAGGRGAVRLPAGPGA